MNSAPRAHSVGHSVLVIPVLDLNAWVRARTAYYDATFVGPLPEFINAHITLLGPWLPMPTSQELALVHAIAATTSVFDFALADLEVFPDGLAYLAPSPVWPFLALTKKLVAAFPDCPPYGGAFGSVVPHLTVDQVTPDLTLAAVKESLAGVLATTLRATQIDLQWWENDNCHLMATWPLGG